MGNLRNIKRKGNKPKVDLIKPPIQLNMYSYAADNQGCGHIRVIFPTLLLNHYEEIAKVKILANYGNKFIPDPNFYKDLLFCQFQRSATKPQLEMLQYFKSNISRQTNTPIIYEIDDLLTEIPDWNFAADWYKPQQEFIPQIMGLMDGMICSTNKLKEVYSKFNKNIRVIPNHLPKFLWGEPLPFKEEISRKPRVYWAGSSNHFAMKADRKGGDFGKDLLDYIRKTVDDIQWVIMGALPRELHDIKDKIEFHQWQSIWKFPQYVKKLDVDIAIAPLEDNLFNSCKCLVKDTRVVTDKGICAIDSVNIKNTIWQENSYKNVASNIKYSNRDTLKFITKKGFEIEGTLNHKLRGLNLYKRMDEFKIGDSVDIGTYDFPDVPYQELTFPMFITKKLDSIDYSSLDDDVMPRVRINEQWGRFIGYVLGDGHLATSNCISISCNKNDIDVIYDITEFASNIGLNYHFVEKKRDDGYSGKGLDIKISSRNLKVFLGDKIGFKGRYGKILRVPDVILKSPKSVIREFLSGLFETDGTTCKKSTSVSFVSKDKDLVRDVQFLLLGFGIVSRIQVYRNKTYDKDYYTLYLGRQASEIFHKDIGFISNRKKSILEERLSHKRSNAFKEFEMNDEIVDIQKSNNDVYDIQVPDGSYYLANGIVSHNSNIKKLEYAILGCPGVYSNVEPYKDATLTCDTSGDIVSNIEKLIGDIDLRHKVYTKDFESVRKQLFWEEYDNLTHYINTYLSLFGKRLVP
jgi:intein/homing endonuclease